MKTLILSAACMLVSIFGSAKSTTSSSATPSGPRVSLYAAVQITAMPVYAVGAARTSLLDRLTLHLNQAGTTYLISRCEKMTCYIPATGNRIAPSVFSLQLRTNTEHTHWTWKISTPILSGTLPSALFSVQLTF
jgi:hypothetical protein